jgi:hypothetical protein
MIQKLIWSVVLKDVDTHKRTTFVLRRCDLNGAVVNVADCYLSGTAFDPRVMPGFFPHVKVVEDIGLTNQPCKSSKTCLVIPKGAALTKCWLLCQFCMLMRHQILKNAKNHNCSFLRFFENLFDASVK